MLRLPESIEQFPNICGSEKDLDEAIAEGLERPVYLKESKINFSQIQSACVTVHAD